MISIIIPVYKVEPYLRRCLDSVLAQTYTDLQIILVDDGSPDGCGAICDEYAKKDAAILFLITTGDNIMKDIELFNDHFQNYKVYGIPDRIRVENTACVCIGFNIYCIGVKTCKFNPDYCIGSWKLRGRRRRST